VERQANTRKDPPAASLATARERRRNYGKLPKPGCAKVPYALSREEFAGDCTGDFVRIVMASGAWQRVMGRKLTDLEHERPKHGPAPAYDSHELESALLFQRLSGCNTYAEARTLLAGDRGQRCRQALDFDHGRPRVGRNLRVVKSLDGVPSEKTVSRHLRRFGLDRHAEAYEQLFEAFVEDEFGEFPEEMAEEMRLALHDGSTIRCHRSSFERKNMETGEVKPPTLTGGGYRPRTSKNADKDGHGFNLHTTFTPTGLPMMARITPINTSEAKTLAKMLNEDWGRIIAPHLKLTDDAFGVFAADGAYSGGRVRSAIHARGYIPNIHKVSHAERERSKDNAARHDQMRFAIEGKRGWYANGHREVFCEHGTQATKKYFRRKNDGSAVCGLEGDCQLGCGHIQITLGEWRVAQNPARFVRVMPGEEDMVDWKMGNPLTFHDPLSGIYGSSRFAYNEGAHGGLNTRFGLLRNKAWYRDIREAKRDYFQTFSIMHALAMEQRRRAATPRQLHGSPNMNGGPPPPLSLVA